MPKYIVYGIATASWKLGEYEAESSEEAERMAEEDPGAGCFVTLCHECAGIVEIGDMYETQIDEIDE